MGKMVDAVIERLATLLASYIVNDCMIMVLVIVVSLCKYIIVGCTLKL